MDHTLALPDDALANILSRLPPRDLAASRCVCKAWLAVVDARRLLHPDDLPRSVHGLFINYVDYDPTRLFARPTTTPPAITLSFLPLYQLGFCTAVDHCNGLLLCWEACGRTLIVVNPATRRWDYIVWRNKNNRNARPHLVFDPAASPHYEVFSIPESPSEIYEQKSAGEQDDQHDLMDWPPSLWTLNVFSSTTRQWKMRSFTCEDDIARTMTTNVQVDPSESIDMCWRQWGSPPRYSAYWRGSLYVHCNDVFVVRLSLSDCKYQLIKAPSDIEKTKHVQFLGKSEKGVHLATVHPRCQLRVWSLTESSGRINWVLKHDIDLETLSLASLHGLRGFNKTWTVADDVHDDNDEDEDDDDDDDDEYDKEGVQKEKNEMLKREDRGWNSDDDNLLNIVDYDTGHSSITFLGFHPYKEVIFLGLPSLLGVAYHLKSSKIQYLGKMRPNDYDRAPTNGIYESFPYTPCMIGELLEQAKEGPFGH